MGRTSKRAVLVKANEPVEIWDKPMNPPGPRETLLRVKYAGVCGTDVHLWRGEIPLPSPIVLELRFSRSSRSLPL